MASNKFVIGGSAVIEGVMMISPLGYAIACRKGEDIILYKEAFSPGHLPKGKLLHLPLVRGILSLFSSLHLSIKALMISYNVFSKGQIYEEKDWKLPTAKITSNFLLGFFLFLVLPDLLSRYFFSSSFLLGNFVELTLRILFLLLYILFVSLTKEGRRLLQYHGAEHKVVNAYEDGAELSPEGVAGYSRLHPRCGSTLVAFLLLFSFLFFMPSQNLPLLPRLLTKLFLLPLSLSLAFEIILFTYSKPRFAFLLAPGLWFQRLTTREPTLDQLEVAIVALKEVSYGA